MRQKLAELQPDPRIAVIARRQHGVVTRAQLVRLGLDDGGIARHVRAGRLHRLYRSVYAVGHTGLTTRGHFLAAVLACGDHAVLSHHSAAALWKLGPAKGPRIHVTVPSGGTRSRRRALVVHRSPLPAQHVTEKDAIRVTTPSRTLIDLADCCSRRELERALDEALYLQLDLSSLEPVPRRRGAGLLANVIAQHRAGTTRTRSEFEELLFGLCRRHNLPQPRVNAVIHGYEVDFSWPQPQVIVEADGWSAHGRRTAFERDRIRDAALQVAGWRVIRITWRRLVREPAVVAAQLRALLPADPA